MSPMIPLFVTVFLFPFVLLGWGALLCRLTLPKKEQDSVTAWQLVMLGFPVLAVLGYLLNFVIPIWDIISDITWITGFVLALTLGRQSLFAFWNQKGLRNTALLLMLVLTLLSRVESHSYDSGYYIYHFRWMKEARMLIGMAAMNVGFGVNSIWFSICALAWNSVTGMAGPFAINTILVVMFLMILIEKFPFRKLLDNKALGLLELFIAFLFVYFLLPTQIGWGRKLIFDTLGSPETTAPATLYAVLAGLWFICSFWSKEPKLKLGLFIAVTSVFVLATKMTYALFVVLPFIWLAFEFRNLDFKKLLPTISFASLLTVLFVIRSYVLSGCVAFPMLCLESAPWAISAKDAAEYSSVGKAYAIDPDSPPLVVLANWDWLELWTVRLLRMDLTKTYLYFLILGTLMYLFYSWFSKKGQVALSKLNLLPSNIDLKPEDYSLKGPEAAMLSLCLAGTILWFLLCPDIRYGYPYFVVGSILIFVLGLYRSGLHRAISRYIMLLVVIGSATFVLNSRMEKTFRSWILKPNQEFPIVPKIEIVEGRTKSGVQYYYPKNGDRCWMSPITCTSTRNDAFHLDRTGFYPMITPLREPGS